jgi:hypothetical protein
MKKLIELYTVWVSKVIFLDPGSGFLYVAGMDDVSWSDFYDWKEAAGMADTTRVTAIGMADDGKFYLCYVADCSSPVVCVVRAPDDSEAIDKFLDEYESMRADPGDVNEAMEANPDQEIYQVSDSGHWYDSETMQVREVKFHSIEA